MEEATERIVQREDLPRLRERHAGERIVFTNGCFDILHRGHVELLASARELGDLLVVGLNSDDSVRRLGKGDGRPFNRQDDRAYLLLMLRCVDCVTIFDEDTPLETIAALRPDVLAKGAEYAPGEIVGADIVEENGGEVVRIDMVGAHSTSALVRRIREEADAP
ncbi:MAG: D-glycero-beta-D-manno-heptose 1-phosphate adenylyltransferase [Candidatus Krumholzibacteriota bacterium]|nr:D-glycero-beta-D-manno-heptose 1-phosphate adenylyltransferase [Candidatus Krumholzibacteriota bacterium]